MCTTCGQPAATAVYNMWSTGSHCCVQHVVNRQPLLCTTCGRPAATVVYNMWSTGSHYCVQHVVNRQPLLCTTCGQPAATVVCVSACTCDFTCTYRCIWVSLVCLPKCISLGSLVACPMQVVSTCPLLMSKEKVC